MVFRSLLKITYDSFMAFNVRRTLKDNLAANRSCVTHKDMVHGNASDVSETSVIEEVDGGVLQFEIEVTSYDVHGGVADREAVEEGYSGPDLPLMVGVGASRGVMEIHCPDTTIQAHALDRAVPTRGLPNLSGLVVEDFLLGQDAELPAPEPVAVHHVSLYFPTVGNLYDRVIGAELDAFLEEHQVRLPIHEVLPHPLQVAVGPSHVES